MELTAKVQDMVSHPSIQIYVLLDVKHWYQSFEVHSDDKDYLAFYCLGKRQLQPIQMFQEASIQLFSLTKLMHIVTDLISLPLPELSLVDPSTQDTPAKLAFQMDNVYLAHKSFEEKYTFFKDHFLPLIF